MPIFRPRFFGQRLFAAFAFLATVAQLAVAVVPLLEGRDGRMASHVEANGAASHFTHSDATCAACQARSIHGTTARANPPLPRIVLAPTANFAAVTTVASADHHAQGNPRAPPRLI